MQSLQARGRRFEPCTAHHYAAVFFIFPEPLDLLFICWSFCGAPELCRPSKAMTCSTRSSEGAERYDGVAMELWPGDPRQGHTSQPDAARRPAVRGVFFKT